MIQHSTVLSIALLLWISCQSYAFTSRIRFYRPARCQTLQIQRANQWHPHNVQLSPSLPAVGALQLFFRSGTTESSITQWKVPRNAIKKYSTMNLPWNIELETSRPATSKPQPVATIRTLQINDVNTIAELCVQEYGTVISLDNNNSSNWLDRLRLLEQWFDREGLRWLVALTSLPKVVPSQEMIPNDHAILVCTIHNNQDNKEEIIGMVEVSRQPVLPQRNPPTYPIPLPFKQLFAIVTQNTIQGWITNLLIAPKYRGCGYSKLLVSACEMIAASNNWDCSSIHLHCDPDPETGRISQKLYQGMGYQALPPSSTVGGGISRYSWMIDTAMTTAGSTSTLISNSVFMIQGVPLLYLRKELDKR